LSTLIAGRVVDICACSEAGRYIKAR